jgi:hypothetical protein
MKAVLWGIKYVLRHHLSERRVPLICGLVLTNQCNLGCRQCRIATRGDKHLGFQETRDAIASFYQEGGRCLYLQGGEPFLWRDKRHGIEDIVEYAHGIGFFTVIIYTNGTLPLDTTADTVFVSDWKRPLAICSVYEKGAVYKCCRYPDDPELCRDCGYLSYAEIDQTLRLKPSAILNALKYF